MEVDRPPLSAPGLTSALVSPGGLWRDIKVVGETGSTNTDLLQAAAAGAAEGAVLAAEAQTAGRGRMGRRWLSPPRASLIFSVLFRPAGVPANSLGWLPLLAGVAAVSALRRVAELEAVLKWPNDVLIGQRKLAGILAEQSGGAIVVGMGINVSELPPGDAGASATCVEAERAGRVSRDELLVGVLRDLEDRYRRWTADLDGCGVQQEFASLCGTIGRTVRVELPGGRVLTGTATEVDSHGRLVLRTEEALTAVSAGDVVHVR